MGRNKKDDQAKPEAPANEAGAPAQTKQKSALGRFWDKAATAITMFSAVACAAVMLCAYVPVAWPIHLPIVAAYSTVVGVGGIGLFARMRAQKVGMEKSAANFEMQKSTIGGMLSAHDEKMQRLEKMIGNAGLSAKAAVKKAGLNGRFAEPAAHSGVPTPGNTRSVLAGHSGHDR